MGPQPPTNDRWKRIVVLHDNRRRESTGLVHYPHISLRVLVPHKMQARFEEVPRDVFFFFNDPAPPEFSSLPLHDALPICTGTSRAVPRLAVRNTSNSSMAVDFSDVDRDGNVDILVVDMLGRGARRKGEIPTHTPLPKLIGQIDDRPQWQRNTLLRNRGRSEERRVGKECR